MNPVTNYERVKQEIVQAATAAGRNPNDINLLPVSKMVDIATIKQLYDHGVREFGENRVPVLAPKFAALPPDIKWHFIGQLQANKVRKVVQMASVIHSVDSIEILQRIDRIAGEENKCPEVLLEISVSGEECKGGYPVARASELAQCASECSHIQWRGLMTMAPLQAEVPEQLEVFGGLRDCRDALAKEFNVELPWLSMGMTRDMQSAIQCGSTWVRIGTAIFS